jgi:predicted amidophosphoribosyltransferase
LFEIDKWNETGSVDLFEKEQVAAASAGVCPDCKAPLEDKHKFCPNCGFKVAA